jgi:hypothetical protein
MPHAAHVESLESRRLLAGHVTVSVDSNFNATIVGDNKSNRITVSLAADSSGYLLTGTGRTTINGSHSALIPTTSAYNFDISMRNGNDQVTFTCTKLATQNLAISMGNGRDKVVIDGITVFGNLQISDGNGNDQVALSGLHITKDLTVAGGNGNDSTALADGVTVGGNLTINGGRGKNTAAGVTDAKVTGTVSLFGIADTKKKHKHRTRGHDASAIRLG